MAEMIPKIITRRFKASNVEKKCLNISGYLQPDNDNYVWNDMPVLGCYRVLIPSKCLASN